MNLLPILRLVALGTVTVFALIVLGLSAHLISTTTTFLGGYFTFSALAVATAVLTLISLPAMIIVDFMRQGAITSMIVVELSWLGFLWVLWLASAGTAAAANTTEFPAGCSFREGVFNTACHEFSAIEAFSFINWIILLAYTVTLLVFSLIAANHGQKVWTSSVKQSNFSNRGVPSTTTGGHIHNPNAAVQYPPQPGMAQV